MDNEQKYGSLKNVVVKRDELVSILAQNKQRHDALFEIAEAGFWLKADEAMKERVVDFNLGIKETQKSFSDAKNKYSKAVESKDKNGLYFSYAVAIKSTNNFNLQYPENQSYEYEKAIKMLEMSIHPEITLSQEEFANYVMNDWGWKKQFNATNGMYVTHATGCLPAMYNNFLVSGCANF